MGRRFGARGRARGGIGRPPAEWNVSDYVTGRFSDSDRDVIDKAIARCADATEEWIEHGMQTAMNKFNADPDKTGNTSSAKSEKKTPAESPGQDKSPQADTIPDTEHESADKKDQ